MKSRPAFRFLIAAAALATTACSGDDHTGADPDSPMGGGAGQDVAGASGSAGMGNSSAGAGGGSGGTPAPDVAFSCDPKRVPPEVPLRKLTHVQMANTVRDLVGATISDGARAKQVVAALEAPLGALPADTAKQGPDQFGTFRRMDQDIQQEQVDALYGLAVAAGKALADHSAWAATLGACATDADKANDAACVEAFLRKLGERAYRRPLEDAEWQRIAAAYGAPAAVDEAALADAIALLLSAPQFVFLVEAGAGPAADWAGATKLTPWELASRLSYQFWDTMPDAALFEAARSGALATDAGYEREVDRVLADPKARTGVDEFVSDWLRLQLVPDMTKNATAPGFAALVGDDAAALPTFRTDAVDEVRAMVRHVVFEDDAASFGDLLTSTRSFTRSATLAKLYGAPVWASGDPPAMPGDAHPGLLTRAALLASQSGHTRPIMRGVLVRKGILCDDVPPPPANASMVSTLPSALQSTRQAVAAVTEAKGTACASCHPTLINPLGFVLERYDALGRTRTMESVYNDAGKELAQLPIDTSSVPRVRLEDDSAVTDARELMQRIVASGKAEACFARNILRNAIARWDDPDIDGCTLERMRQALAAHKPIKEAFKELAMSAQFRHKGTTP